MDEARAARIELTRIERGAASRAEDFVAREEPLIGYEASNHYYYTPVDLFEKILNCDQVIASLVGSA